MNSAMLTLPKQLKWAVYLLANILIKAENAYSFLIEEKKQNLYSTKL